MLETLKRDERLKFWVGTWSHMVLLFAACSSLRVAGATGGCPSCDEITCLTSVVNQTSCPKGTYYRDNIVCGCCPACIKFRALNEKCVTSQELFQTTAYPVIQSNSVIESNQCAPGMACEGKCVVDEGTCFSYNYQNVVLTRPACDPDGSFAAVQCKGDFINGRCFCYNQIGERIFGMDWWKDADDMTCACSREVASIVKAGVRTDVSLHCSSNGNYEELQCDDSLCWCADPKTGLPLATVVPEKMMEILPCFIEMPGKAQYLQQCESIAMSVNRIRDIAKKHGSFFSSAALDQCDPDGSYGPVQNVYRQAHCTGKDKVPIESYQSPLSEINDMDCNCARDVVLYEENDLIFYMDCGPNGDYKDLQAADDKTFCVDSDGYPTTKMGHITTCEKW